jgi:hypothetical protein
MSRYTPRTLTLAMIVMAGVVACSQTKPQAKLPLGHPTASGESAVRDALPEAARVALDKGNAEFRARKFEAALVEYRAAAKAAPTSSAPYFGIYMAAQKLNNTALADSASKAIAARPDATPMLGDSALRSVHNGPTPKGGT